MPSREHELSIEMLSRKPALLGRLLRQKKLAVPKCVLLAETESVRWQSTRVADLVVVGRVDACRSSHASPKCSGRVTPRSGSRGRGTRAASTPRSAARPTWW